MRHISDLEKKSHPLPEQREGASAQPLLMVIGPDRHALPVKSEHFALSTSETLRQCAWCGVILTGPWQGASVLTPEEGHRPYLLPFYSHGLCATCKARVRREWQQSRAAIGRSVEQERPRCMSPREPLHTSPCEDEKCLSAACL